MKDEALKIIQAKRDLKRGNLYPYDLKSPENTPPVDWTHTAARGIMADLSDRTHLKDGSIEPFVFTAAVIGYQINTKTEEHSRFQTEQYVDILSKAFQKGYENAIA